MATQLITLRTCDFCAAEDKQTPDAINVLVAINGEQFEVDACDEHAAPLQALRETLAEHGRKIPTRGRKPANSLDNVKPSQQPLDTPLICPECGVEMPSRARLAGHGRTVHGKTIAELLGEPLDFKCDECGRLFGTVQGLAVHTQRTHS